MTIFLGYIGEFVVGCLAIYLLAKTYREWRKTMGREEDGGGVWK